MAVGQPDAPEGVETTRVADLPPGPPAPPAQKPEPPQPKPAAVQPPVPQPEVRKPEAPKEIPKPVKEPPKPEAKPKKEEKPKPFSLSDPGIDKLAEKDKTKASPKIALSDPGLEKLLAKEMEASANSPANVGGGMANATVGTVARVGMGDPNSTETGVSVKGMPGILSTWAKQVERKVLRFWSEPGGVPSSKVSVSFWVGRDGSLVSEPEIMQASNYAGLDESALNAVRLAAPFPPLPPQFDQPKQQVIFIFNLTG